ncbi:hypothetical protein M422DRAFT_253786 [Sphaerobolus stellatus SS14]|uniref:DUF6534 domain-containing protein n=1 Tax=Sphaerobolus stellatus (strain SS14) TaxID=990650 RepID=A0A0C9VX81_SPHS4|nr:hypothetical protein M422DRAFT_253786 [Sphaerobolus stellatus SS14]
MSDEVKTLIEAVLSVYLATSISAILVAVTIAQGTFYYRNYDGDSKLIKYFARKSNFEIVSQCTDTFVKASIPFEYGSRSQNLAHWNYNFFVNPPIRFDHLLVLVLYGELMTKFLGTGIAATAYGPITRSISRAYARGTLITQGIASTSTILCDALISGSLVYFLREKPMNRSIRIGIGKITIYSINIGLITVAVSTITLITWLAAPHPQLTWEIFYYPAAQVYVNSVLVSLNARKEIRAQMIKNYSRPQSSMFMSFNVDVSPSKRGTRPLGHEEADARDARRHPLYQRKAVQPCRGLEFEPEQSRDRVHRRQLSRRGRIPERAGAHPKIPVS